jgi:hypothetical protein
MLLGALRRYWWLLAIGVIAIALAIYVGVQKLKQLNPLKAVTTDDWWKVLSPATWLAKEGGGALLRPNGTFMGDLRSWWESLITPTGSVQATKPTVTELRTSTTILPVTPTTKQPGFDATAAARETDRLAALRWVRE